MEEVLERVDSILRGLSCVATPPAPTPPVHNGGWASDLFRMRESPTTAPTPPVNDGSLGGFSTPATAPPVYDPETDRSALMVLLDSTNGPDAKWRFADGWGTSAPLSEWRGLAVDGEGRVTKLWQLNAKLTGGCCLLRFCAAAIFVFRCQCDW